jgi:P4 family phage/plasmid primase-like protien
MTVLQRLTASGIPVLPCVPGGKAPETRLVPNGMDSATTHWPTVEGWLRQTPTANWAVRTGPIETGPWAGRHLAILDIDDVLVAAAVLERTKVQEVTAVTRTPRGGLHIWALSRQPAYTGKVLASDGSPLGDLKGTAQDGGPGGYVLVFGQTEDGDYDFRWGPGPILVDSATAWFESLLSAAGVEARLKGEEKQASYHILAERPAQVGERNITLFSYACALRRAGLGFQDILRHLQEMNADPSKVAVPLPHKELEHIASSACRYEAGNGYASFETPPTEVLERQLDEAPTDLNHARIVADRLRGRICWVPAWGWMVYRDGVWHRDPDGAAAARLAAEALSQHYLELAMGTRDLERRRDLLRQAITAQARARAENALHMARDLLRAVPQDFDARPGLLCARNGVVDLTTGQLLPHSPDYRFTRQTAVAYDPHAPAPQWEAFLRQIFLDNGAIISFMQRLLGMALLGRNRERAFVIWWGRGRNGKSALATVLRLVLGSYATTTPVGTFARLGVEDSERPSPELASLVGRRLVVAHEPQERVKLSASFIKNVTGNDAVKARTLFHEPFEFWPDFLPVLVTNHLPELPGTDQALWDRLYLLPFLWRVPDDQVVPALGERLAREEGEGVLRWLAEGAMAYLREGLKPPAEVQAATAQFRAETDALFRFFIEETEGAPQARTPYRDIRRRYEEWCKGEGVTPESDRRLSDALAALGYRRRKTRDGVVYEGVRLRDDGEPPAENDEGPSPVNDVNDVKGFPAKFSGLRNGPLNYKDNPSHRSHPSHDHWATFEPEEDKPPAQGDRFEETLGPQQGPRCSECGGRGDYTEEGGGTWWCWAHGPSPTIVEEEEEP